MNKLIKPVIKATNIKRVYTDASSDVNALNGVSFNILAGEFTAIVGPSGSGKTTLLNIIGGLDTPSSGSIHIDGKDISSLSEKELTTFRLHNIGFVFQSYNLIPVLTAWENVAFIMTLQGCPKEQTEERTKSLLTKVGLNERMNSRPSHLSGGEQQRVAVARALSARPKFILADEPTANLDSKSAKNLLDMMIKLNKQEKVTFIFSTHDPNIMAKANRIIMLEDGKIKKDSLKHNK